MFNSAQQLVIPETMRASVLRKQGDVVVEEREVPTPASDQVLIEVATVGVCGSDVHYFQHGRIGDFVVEEPMILGHEASGRVVAVGENVSAKRIGQRVAIEPQRCCRVCDYCKSGQYNLCRSIEFYATPPIDGAFAQYVTMQDDFAFEIPQSMSYEAAALLEPLSVGIAAVEKADFEMGGSVLIAGGGPIGVILAQTARAYGAAQVVVSEPVASRRDIAVHLGATKAYAPGSVELQDAKFDAFIDASGVTAAVVDGIKNVKPGGRAIIVGMGEDDMTLPVSYITANEVNLTGIFRYHRTWPKAIALVNMGLVNLDALVTDKFGLDEVPQALDATRKESTLKVMVYPGR